ncbi:MAG: oligosaccharide flippase family protein [Candidatus Marinimicrobia bacterium]|nr:oligosaccharide flippase family protein [Candidatus Neomarinimicrobiota bacterium]
MHYLRIQNKASVFTSIILINVLINVGLNIYLIRYRGMGIDAVFISNIAASAFNFLVLIPVVVKNWNSRFSSSLWRKLILFGLPFIPGGLSSMIIELSDRYMLEWFEGLRVVGLYSAGHKLGIFMMLVVMAFRFAWQPFFLQKHDDPQTAQLFAKILTYFVFVMSIVFPLISFFIQEIVSLEIMGKHLIESDYWAGTVVVPVHPCRLCVQRYLYQLSSRGLLFRKDLGYFRCCRNSRYYKCRRQSYPYSAYRHDRCRGVLTDGVCIHGSAHLHYRQVMDAGGL